jgi:hypothetical protein
MKLDRSEIICGQSAKKIRDFLGNARNGAFYRNDRCDTVVLINFANDYFGGEAKAVLAELFKRGWMVRGDRDGERDEPKKVATVSLTQSGKQSRVASLQKRIPRAVGEQIVTELIERARSINARDDLLFGVGELRLFGSMLDPEAVTVGDVDVAFELFFNKRPTDETGDQIKRAGKEVELLLKARKPRVSLQTMVRFEDLKPAPRYRVIFTRRDAEK